MTAKPRSPTHPDSVPDVPPLGLVRPPLVYLTSLVIGAMLQFALPLPFFPQTLNAAVGASLVVVAMALVSYSVAKFRAAGTPVPARNPIYLAFSLLQLGMAIWVNSLWLLATLVGAAALIHSIVIRREEHYLEQKFGAGYLDYKASVRRWL